MVLVVDDTTKMKVRAESGSQVKEPEDRVITSVRVTD